MLEQIELYNFKSAHELKVKLSQLTVFTGLNGSGKSTVLQAIALLKQSLRSNYVEQELLLRGPLVNLGRSEDVRFENATTDEIQFLLRTPNGVISIASPAMDGQDTLPIRSEGDVNDLVSQLDQGFQMIQADRMTPAGHYQQASTRQRNVGWLGCGGEYTVDYLLRHESDKVSSNRLFPRTSSSVTADLIDHIAPTETLIDQTSGWLQHFSPGVRPRAVAVELADATSLRFSYTGTSVDSISRDHRPSNVGFGLTYVLPIIVACLAAPTGSLILLENPEAHLHPRGQSALGLLLALCAADGVQIIVETHSDHLINGIRVAAKKNQIMSESVAVHFFSRDIETGASHLKSPVLQSNGRFNEWPEGFFDEWSRALDELLD